MGIRGPGLPVGRKMNPQKNYGLRIRWSQFPTPDPGLRPQPIAGLRQLDDAAGCSVQVHPVPVVGQPPELYAGEPDTI